MELRNCRDTFLLIYINMIDHYNNKTHEVGEAFCYFDKNYFNLIGFPQINYRVNLNDLDLYGGHIDVNSEEVDHDVGCGAHYNVNVLLSHEVRSTVGEPHNNFVVNAKNQSYYSNKNINIKNHKRVFYGYNNKNNMNGRNIVEKNTVHIPLLEVNL